MLVDSEKLRKLNSTPQTSNNLLFSFRSDCCIAKNRATFVCRLHFVIDFKT